MRRRPFCAEVALEDAEPLAATASRVDNWILVEYRGVWGHDALASSTLGSEVKAHLDARRRALAPAKVLLVRRSRRLHDRALSVFWGSSRPGGTSIWRAELRDHDELLELDFESPGEPVAHPLLLVCTHGKHDRCCARYGLPLYEAVRTQAEEEWVWQVSHIGGDRFAGNIVCLPDGLYFGHVRPSDARAVLDDYLAGRIDLPHYRGRSAYSFPVQAAERRVREELALAGIDDVELLEAEVIDGIWRVRFRAGGRDAETEVTAELGEPTYMTCTAEVLTRPRRYVAGNLRVSAA